MKKFNVEVISGSKTTEVLEKGFGKLKLRVEFPASTGKVNESVIDLLAFYLGIEKNQIVILSDVKSKYKKIAILN
jgi:uncharacterized protein YggU (UPF0235/DUF167 family)